MSESKITKDNFKTEVMQAETPVLLDFFAEWCGPCKMLAPAVAEIAEEYAGKIKVGKVNVDEEPELAAAFDVESIPTLVVVKDGKVAQTAVGYRPKTDIIRMLG